MVAPSKTSLSGLLMAAVVGSSGCGADWTAAEDQCTDPLIYSLSTSPDKAYISDSVIITTYLQTTCFSVPVLTFPDYDSSVLSSFSGYESEPFALAGVEGIVLERITDEDLVYATQALPMDSFAPGYLRYSLTVYGGIATLDKKDTLNNYMTLLSADTGE